jgi:NAD(P)-dependent dehydrogenase (short-subunit alcohol dehydrogenase family)
MSTVLVTGANRGIGLEFCRQYGSANWTVIACCREPEQAFELIHLSQKLSIHIEAVDVSKFEQIDALSKKLTNISIDLLINNAGIYPDSTDSGFGALGYDFWTQAFLVNTMSPVKMAEAFLPQIKRSNKKLLVNISSLMGSIADNTSGGSLFYRTSKAALNAAMKTLSIDLEKQQIGVLTLHPGWVKTDMGGRNALISVNESVLGMRTVIENYASHQSGSFIKFDGTSLPW